MPAPVSIFFPLCIPLTYVHTDTRLGNEIMMPFAIKHLKKERTIYIQEKEKEKERERAGERQGRGKERSKVSITKARNTQRAFKNTAASGDEEL